ncbi:MAG: diaminopimelate epimerase [Pseudomonadota bacterium]
MTMLSFSKMHGLGNDFMVLDLVTQHWDVDPHRVAAWGNRHTGVGFDQLLILAPPADPDADFAYRIYNTDGSAAEQCGNGARCIARFAHERGLSPKAELIFETATGRMTTVLKDQDQVEVDLGSPVFEVDAVPFLPPATPVDDCYTLPTSQGPVQLLPVSMGNPHGVVFVEQVAEAPVAELGPELTGHEAFPEQANIGFCQVIDRGFLRLRVHERGIGETLACGSGACAAVAAAHQRGLVDDRVKVSLPGGKVRISIEPEQGHLLLSGSTSTVFSGSIEV